MLMLVAGLMGLMLLPFLVLMAPLLIWFIVPLGLLAIGIYASNAARARSLHLAGALHGSARP